MLREHGAQRPTVFELLDHVHRLRGTKSRFTYNVPPKAPPLSPTRASATPLQTLSPNVVSSQAAKSLDDLVSLKSQQPLSTSPSKNAGIEARDKVLEAIAPMRRGRPPVATTQPSSPKKQSTFEMDMKFGAEDDHVWRGVRGHKSGLAAVHAPSSQVPRESMDAWGVGRKGTQEPPKDARASFEKGFGDDFSAGFSKTFGDSFQPSRSPLPSPKPPQPTPSPRPPAISTALNRNASVRKPKDAFDGLGFAAQPPPQTLGEARKSRTGLASMHMGQSNAPGAAMASYLSTPGTQMSGFGTSNASFRPPSSHVPMPSPSPRPIPQPSTTPSVPSWRPSSSKNEPLTAEERFPSLEELDREFASPSPSTAAEKFAMAHASAQPPSAEKHAAVSRPPSRGGYMANLRSAVGDAATGAGTSASNGTAITGGKRNLYEGLGARSQNVTGTAMRESRFGVARAPSVSLRPPQVSAEPSRSRERERERPRSPQKQRDADEEKPQDVTAVLRSRPSAARRRRTKTPSRNNSAQDALVSPVQDTAPSVPSLPPRPLPSPGPRAEPRDWLTGADDEEVPAKEAQPVMRESPSKRASFIERSPIQLVKAFEAEEVLASYEKPERAGDPQKPAAARKPAAAEVRPSWERREPERERTGDRQHPREERQRSPGKPKAFAARKASGAGGNPNAVGSANTRVLQLPPVDTRTSSRTSTLSSPNGLTDNWSPVAPAAEPAPLTAKSSSSSSGEEGPEDLGGWGAARRGQARTKGEDGLSTEDRRKQARSKGRQSSVHDLVDLWGGGVGEKEKEPTKPSTSTSSSRVADAAKRRSVIMPSPAARPPPLASKPSLQSETPQPLVDTSVPGRSSNMGPPPSPHKRQPSATPSGSRMQATPMAAASSMPPLMSGRSRPQSMFITSPSKSGYLAQPGPSPSPVPSTASSATNALSPPADPRPRAGRRSSISDMVQHYEAIQSSTVPGSKSAAAPGPGPTSSIKPAPLNLRSKSSAGATMGDASLPSPSAAAARFPRLSPSSSPVISKASLAVPDDAGQGRAERDSGRRSPGLAGLPSRMSPVPRASDMNGLPGRRSPFQAARETPAREHEVPPSPAPGPFPTRKPTLPPLQPTANFVEREDREPVRSPSPERPYQGVSKLIDRWQKAVDSNDTGGVRKPVAKKAGVAR